MSWYRTGTAAFTNGNATVTGTGTAWIANASIGEGLIAPDGRIYEITAIASDTSLTISPAYLGSTASGQAYAVAPIRGRIAQLLSETSSLLASFATVRDGIGSGLFPNGTVSAPALRAAADQDTGLFFPAANTLAMVTGGAERLRVTSVGLDVAAGDINLDNGQYYKSDNAAGGSVRMLGINGSNVAYIGAIDSGPLSTIINASSTSATAAIYTAGSERMRIASNGKVGIGTTAPTRQLHVVTTEAAAGEFNGVNTFVDITDSTVSGRLQSAGNIFNIGTLEAGKSLAFKTGAGTERMRIDSNGNVGIGTSSPGATLHVNTLSGEGNPGLSSGECARFQRNSAFNASASIAIIAGSAADAQIAFGDNSNAQSGLIRYRNTSDAMLFMTGGVNERMRIDSSGNVGIGTTNPTVRLEVHGGSSGTASLRSRIVGGTNNPVLDIIHTEAGGVSTIRAVSSTATAALAFDTRGTERMRIDSNGNVGIGTSSPTRLLDLVGTNGAQFRVQNTTANATLKNSYFNVGHFTNSEEDFIWSLAQSNASTNDLSLGGGTSLGNAATSIRFFTAADNTTTTGTERMRITSGGTVRPGADNTQSLGEASLRWSTVFAGTGTINISDEREKVWRGAMTEAEMRAAKRLLAELGMFQFTDSIEEKGEDARLHFGVRAQKAFAILEDEGLEWRRYAWCCHDKWDEITEPVMEEVAVEKTRTVEKPVTVEKTRTVEVPEEREVEKTETVMEPVFDEETGEQVMDENGEPVMTEIEQTFTVTETVMVEVEETYEETVFEDVEETYEETEQRDTGEVRVVREAGDRYGIRADQLAYWLIAAQAEIQNDLDARLAKLEAAQ